MFENSNGMPRLVIPDVYLLKPEIAQNMTGSSTITTIKFK
jgi:hypothetical protein